MVGQVRATLTWGSVDAVVNGFHRSCRRRLGPKSVGLDVRRSASFIQLGGELIKSFQQAWILRVRPECPARVVDGMAGFGLAQQVSRR